MGMNPPEGPTWGSIEADGDKPIWRYMDLARYLTLLSQGLHFSRITMLGDPWEGSWTYETVDDSFSGERDSAGSPELANAIHQERLASKTQWLEKVGVSCWHYSDVESDALWEKYARRGAGVAIRSTPNRVKKSINPPDGDRLEYHRVRYIDYNMDGASTYGYRSILSSKRHIFASENEVRFIVDLTHEEDLAIHDRGQEQEARSYRWIFQSHQHKDEFVNHRPTPDRSFEDSTVISRSTPAGIYLLCEPGRLIEKVRVAAGKREEIWQSVIDASKAYDLDPRIVERSDMENPPFDARKYYGVDQWRSPPPEGTP